MTTQPTPSDELNHLLKMAAKYYTTDEDKKELDQLLKNVGLK